MTTYDAAWWGSVAAVAFVSLLALIGLAVSLSPGRRRPPSTGAGAVPPRPRRKPCTACDGKGRRPWAPYLTCPICLGSGAL